MSVRRVLVVVALAVVSVLAVAATQAGADIEHVDRSVGINLPDAGVDVTNLSWDELTGAIPDPLNVKIPDLAALGPIDLGPGQVTIDRDALTLSFEDLGGTVTLGAADFGAVLSLILDWEDTLDSSPTVEFTFDSTATEVVVDDLVSFGSAIIPGVSLSEATFLRADLGLTGFAFAFHGNDGDDNFLDLTGQLRIAGLDYALLVSVDEQPDPEPVQVVAGLRAAAPGGSPISLGAVLGNSLGQFASDLKLPTLTFGTVLSPAGAQLDNDDLREGVPTEFFSGCAAAGCPGLDAQWSIGTGLTIDARLDITSLGDDVRGLFGVASTEPATLRGSLDVELGELEDGPDLDLTTLVLNAHLPGFTTPQGLPAWLETGTASDGDGGAVGTTLSMKYLDAVERVEASLVTSGRATIDDGGGSPVVLSFDPVEFKLQATGDAVKITLHAESGEDWNTPFGVAWASLEAVELDGLVDRKADGTWVVEADLASDFTLCADPTPTSTGACTDATAARLAVQVGATDADVAATFRITLGADETDVPVFALLDVVAAQFGAPPVLGDELLEVTFDDLAIAGFLKSDGSFRFEARGTSPAILDYGAFTGYFSFSRDGADPVNFFAGIRPDDGFDFQQLLGAHAPPGLEDVDLPTLGVIASTAALKTPAAELSPDAFAFFRELYGCAPTTYQPGTESPPVDPGTPADQQPKPCQFEVEIDSGVNLLANITFPGELATLGEQLWIDAEQGLQIRGTFELPGLLSGDVELALGLEIVLPRMDPGDAMEFIEEGQLSIAVRLEGTQVTLSLEGDLDTRWRRADIDVGPNGDCAGTRRPDGKPIGGNAMPWYTEPSVDGTPLPDDWYCYDQITLGAKAALTISPTLVDVTFTLFLDSDDGWAQPFGMDWLTIYNVTGQFGVRVEGPTFNSPSFVLGFQGDIELGSGSDGVPPTRVILAGSFGLTIVNPAPTPAGIAVTPKFLGFRGYFSRLGTYDLLALQELVTGEAIPQLTVPEFELRDGELMIGLERNDDLCIDQRIGVAAELWLTTESATGGDQGATPPASSDCRPFGVDVTPENCASSTGCFASSIVDVSLDGIRAAGAVAALDFGPIHLDDTLVDVRLTPLEQLFKVHGGMTIDGVGSGRVAMTLQGLPSPSASVYGHLDVFGAFEAVIDGTGAITLEFPPGLDGDVEFHAALTDEFESVMKAQLQTALRSLQQQVEAIAAVWDAFVADPVGALADTRAHLRSLGVDLPEWVDGLLGVIEETAHLLPSAVELPPLDVLLAGGTYTTSFPASRTCEFGSWWDAREGVCVNLLGTESAPTGWSCPFLATLDGSVCRVEITLPAVGEIPGLPGSGAAVRSAIADLYETFVTTLDGVGGGFDLSHYIDKLAEDLDRVSLVTVPCAEFGFRAGDDSTVDLALVVTLLGQPYGFDRLSLDLGDVPGTIGPVLDELVGAFLEGEAPSTDCAGPATPPAGIDADEFDTLALSVADATIDEGETATVTGTFASPPEGTVEVVVDWGDGDTSTHLVSTPTFQASHVYADDAPSGTPADDYVIGATVTGSATVVTGTGVTVRNVAPEVAVIAAPDVDEGETGTLEIVVDDVDADTHLATVDWGDGTVESIAVTGGSLTVDHTWVDDEPTGTSTDTPTVSVEVTDDDGGTTTATATAVVANVAPTIPSDVLTGIGATTFVEGDAVTIDVGFDDPGVADTHHVRVTWGDGTADVVTVPAGERSVGFTHTFSDDDPTGTPADTYTLTLAVVDDDRGQIAATVDVTVGNVAPTVDPLTLDAAVVDEHGTVTVSGTFTDPGTEDTHSVVVDWGDPTFANTTILLPAGDRAFEASRQYGDNGTYPIAVTVTDDDTGSGTVSTAVQVDNVAPVVAIDEDGTIDPPSGGPTFVLREKELLTLAARAIDPGSDDLTFLWNFDDGQTAAHGYLVGTDADPFPSPSVSPRDVTDTVAHAWDRACLYTVEAAVTDDDAGRGADRVAVVVTGAEHRVRNAGWWDSEFNPRARNNKHALSDERLRCYLDIAAHLSSAFDELRPLASFEAARDVLMVDRTSEADELLDRQLLTTWLNLAHGSLQWEALVDTDGDRMADTPLGDVLAVAEHVRLTSTDRGALLAQKAVLEDINS